MKIAHIVSPWLTIPPQNYGGTETVLFDLIEAQTRMGHQVTLYSSGQSQTSARLVSFFSYALREADIPWENHFQAYYHIYHALKDLQENPVDIIHVHLSANSDLYFYPLLAGYHIPCVATLHSNFPFDHLPGHSPGADQLFLEAWGEQIPIVCISKQACKGLPEQAKLIGIVHNGIEFPSRLPGQQSKQDYLAWIGRFIPDKGPHIAIEVAKRANQRLVLAGTIDNAIPEAVEYFHEQIEPHIDNDQIRYIGPVDRDQKIELLYHAHAFLNPIQWEEPFGMVMLEAIAVECPVISFARGAAVEIVQHNKSGFLVENTDEMLHFLSQISSLNRSFIRKEAEKRFSSQVMAQNYLNKYHQVIQMKQEKTYV